MLTDTSFFTSWIQAQTPKVFTGMKMQAIKYMQSEDRQQLLCCYNTSALNNLQQSDTIKIEEAPHSASAFHLLSRAQPLTWEDKQLFIWPKPGFCVCSNDEASAQNRTEQHIYLWLQSASHFGSTQTQNRFRHCVLFCSFCCLRRNHSILFHNLCT